MKNGIYIVATPIGNMADISERARSVLQNADVIACEDTRIAKKLFTLLGLETRKPFITLHDHNEEEHAAGILEMAKNGNSIALISDAGSPLISDPGYKLIRRCRQEGVCIYTIPGPCALICALQLSGLPTNKFMFAGFIPNKDKAREDLFNNLKGIDATLIFYETANRIVKTLKKAGEVFGNREMSVAREITKMYEECLNGTAEELICRFEKNEPRGEMVLMVSPPAEKEKPYQNAEDLLRQELAQNSLKTAVRNLVEKYGFNKNEIYELALRIKNE